MEKPSLKQLVKSVESSSAIEGVNYKFPRTSIIIVCWNQVEFTKECVESVMAYTPEKHEIIFVNNGSTDGTKEYLASVCKGKPNYTVLENPKNIGFPAAVNEGLELAQGEYICLLNNDVIVTPEWMRGMIECMESNPANGIVGARSNYVSGLQQVNEGKYSNVHEMIEFSRKFRKAFKGLYQPWWRIVFFCTLIKKEVFEKVGNLDELFTPGNFEDDDFSRRAVLGGFRNVIAGDVFVHHFGSVSCKEVDFTGLLNTNRKKYEEKWAEWLKDHNKISCSMIVKNEEAHIGSCLDHIIPLVDEVVLVDTGSTDKTKEIAATKGDKVKIFDFPWCDDFSKARNFADGKTTGDWIFSLDADEVITELDRSMLKPLTVYGYETRNYTTKVNYKGWQANTGEYRDHEKGVGWFPSLKIRLYPKDSRLFWSYPVHEVLEPTAYELGMERVICPVPVHHEGKFDEKYDAEKGLKYYEYLKQAVDDHPGDLRHLEELATQAQNLERFEEALGLWNKYLEKQPDYNGWLNHGHCLACLGRNEEARQSSQKAWDLQPDSREAAMNTAVLLFRLGQYERAREIARDVKEKNPEYPIPTAVYNACETKIKGGLNEHVSL